MPRVHISRSGEPGLCRAQAGNCPLGGADGTQDHFDSMEEAWAHVEKTYAQDHALVTTLKKNKETVGLTLNEQDKLYALENSTARKGALISDHWRQEHPERASLLAARTDSYLLERNIIDSHTRRAISEGRPKEQYARARRAQQVTYKLGLPGYREWPEVKAKIDSYI